ncbi:MAG: ABC transporter ATP-binding protein/permease [Clostridia bacterium]|nr:ABC transporter ATP-binding protein/permease [Clostridia bacterium]
MKDIKRFFQYFKGHKGLFALDMSCAFLAAIIDVAFPLVSRIAMYDYLPNNAYRAFFTLITIVVVAFLLKSVLMYIITYYGHMFGIRVEADIRKDLFAHFQKLGYDYYDKHITGQLMNRMTGDLFEVTELAHHGPEDVLISFVTIVGSLIVMFTIEWRLAIVVSLLIPIFVLVVMALRRRMMAASMKVKEKMALINGEIESGLSGMKTSQAFANEDIDYDKFNVYNDIYRNSKTGFYNEMGKFNGAQEFFTSIMQVAVIAVGGLMIMKGSMNYIDLITFSLYIAAFINPVRRLANFAEIFMSGFAGLKRFGEIMRTEPTITDSENAISMEKATGLVEVKNVSFKYDEEGILEDVSFKVTPGKTIALVGPSGGGKTTMCHLIPRFYDVDKGEILIDGTNVKNIKLTDLRSNIGIVQQDVFLFADTIMENIRYGRPDATDEEVIKAAKLAEIFDDILDMPDGFDTYVGERGTLLSGGQKQRISIARTILKDPAILILDEATSALDSVTEAKIQSAFDSLSEGRTTIIIAHRLSTIRKAGHIIVIDKGKIVEEGSHKELLEKGGMYAKLYETQNACR